MEESPLVSVILCVFNDEDHIGESIKSLLYQSYQNLQIIIIDDCSKDNSLKICESFFDKRIHLFKNKKNIGLTKSLNIGLKHANGEFIIRQDSDDISYPNRVACQLKYMQSNKDLMVLGSNFNIMDKNGNLINHRKIIPLKYHEVMFYALFDNPLVHSSVMIRGSVFSENSNYYDTSYKTNQDAELWSRLLLKHKIENLPECLISLRYHKDSISNNYNKNSISNIQTILKNNIDNQLKFNPNPNFLENWISLRFIRKKIKFSSLIIILKYINFLHHQFKLTNNKTSKGVQYYLFAISIKQYFKISLKNILNYAK